MDFKLGQKVSWLECPGSVAIAAVTYIRGLSPCGKYALLWWLRNPVLTSTLKGFDEYQPFNYPTSALLNHWQTNYTDMNTGDNLMQWVTEYESRNGATANDGGNIAGLERGSGRVRGK